MTDISEIIAALTLENNTNKTYELPEIEKGIKDITSLEDAINHLSKLNDDTNKNKTGKPVKNLGKHVNKTDTLNNAIASLTVLCASFDIPLTPEIQNRIFKTKAIEKIKEREIELKSVLNKTEAKKLKKAIKSEYNNKTLEELREILEINRLALKYVKKDEGRTINRPTSHSKGNTARSSALELDNIVTSLFTNGTGNLSFLNGTASVFYENKLTLTYALKKLKGTGNDSMAAKILSKVLEYKKTGIVADVELLSEELEESKETITLVVYDLDMHKVVTYDRITEEINLR